MSVPVTEKSAVESRTVVHRAVVAAPAALCFDLVAQVERAPRFFDSHLHAEVTAGPDGQETVARWVVLPGGGVRHWTARRTVDAAARRIVFGHAGGGRPPVTAMRGEWSFTEAADGTAEVRLEHALTFAAGTPDEAAERALADIDRGGRAQLDQLRTVAESYGSLTARTVEAAAGALLTGARAAVAYERLAGAAEVYGEGWAKALVPGRAVVLKRTGRDARLRSATVHAHLAETPAGLRLTLSATATAAPDGPAPEALHRWLSAATARALSRFTDG